jgi:hypothetical protein
MSFIVREEFLIMIIQTKTKVFFRFYRTFSRAAFKGIACSSNTSLDFFNFYERTASDTYEVGLTNRENCAMTLSSFTP